MIIDNGEKEHGINLICIIAGIVIFVISLIIHSIVLKWMTALIIIVGIFFGMIALSKKLKVQT
jgi:hypothetical protein